MPHPVLQSSTQGFYVFADDADAYGEGLAGLSITVSLSKSGGTFNTVSPAITDRGGGVYWIAPLAAHRDTLGEIAWRFTAAGAVIAPRFERVVAVNDQVAAWGVPAAVLAAATDSGGIASNIIAKDGEPFVPLPYQPASQETLLEVQGAVAAGVDLPQEGDVRAGIEYGGGLYVGVLDVGTGLPIPEYPPGSAGL